MSFHLNNIYRKLHVSSRTEAVEDALTRFLVGTRVVERLREMEGVVPREPQ